MKYIMLNSRLLRSRLKSGQVLPDKVLADFVGTLSNRDKLLFIRK
jgi:hypothetical protein